MLNVQSALRAANVPAFRGSYRRGVDEQPPGQYVVYTVKRVPEDYWDDAPHSMAYCPELTLFSRGSPAALSAAVEAAMGAEGFRLTSRTETYDRYADLYEIETQWIGEAAL